MSATSYAAESGVVLGVAFVLLAQQLGYLGLSDLVHAIEYLVIGGVVGGVLFGLIGWLLGHRYLQQHPNPVPPQSP